MTDNPIEESVEKKAALRFSRGLPECPNCKTIKNMRYFNVTQKIYECTHCKKRIRVID